MYTILYCLLCHLNDIPCRDMLYQLDMDLGLLSNLTWETNASQLSMCTPSTVSMASLYMHLLHCCLWHLSYLLMSFQKIPVGIPDFFNLTLYLRLLFMPLAHCISISVKALTPKLHPTDLISRLVTLTMPTH